MTEMGDVIGHFENYLLTERRVSNNTFLAYKRDLKQFEHFLNQIKLKLGNVNKRHLNAYLKYLREQGIGATSLSRKISALKLFYRFIANTFQYPDLAKALVFPKIDKLLPQFLTESEIERLLNAANKDESYKGIRNKVMLYLLYASGMRVTELVNITTDQIQFDTGFVRIVGKGNKERMVPLPKNVLELLHFYLDHVYYKLLPKHASELPGGNKGYLFVAMYKNHIKPMSRQAFWFSLKKVLKQASITKNISPHGLRHSLATHLLQKGADLRSLQMLLGHQNLATVQVYTHLENSDLRKLYNKKHPRA